MAATKTLNTVTLPNGATVSKASKRAYTHAVVSDRAVFGWCGSRALAEKELRKLTGWAVNNKGSGIDLATDGGRTLQVAEVAVS